MNQPHADRPRLARSGGQDWRQPLGTAMLAALCSSTTLAQPAVPAAPAPTQATQATNQPAQMSQARRIRITDGRMTLTATLEDSPAATDFATMLPLQLTLEDYAASEKIATLPRKLATQGAPAGIDPAVGDLAYYAPWGNLAIYYGDAVYATGLVRLGRIDGSTALLRGKGPMQVRIESLPP